MTSPLSYLYQDQDIFNFSNPNDLRQIYKEENQSMITDTSWNFNPTPEQITTETRERSNSFPHLTPQRTPDFPGHLFPIQDNPVHRRTSSPGKKPITSMNKEVSDDSSLGEDNGMEFFFEDEISMDTSSYDMESLINEQSSTEDIIPEHEEPANVSAHERNFKLQSSKSPVIDALFFCALTKQGLTLIDDGEKSKVVQFRLHDFPLYYAKSKDICSKAHPTDDINSRVKALQRWFPDFPSLKELQKGMPYVFGLSRDKHHVNFGKLQVILERQRALLRSADSNGHCGSPSKPRKNSRGT